MTSANTTSTAANHTAQALYQIESLLKAFEQDSKANNISSSPEDDSLQSLAYYGIYDSLTLNRYDTMKLEGDDISDRDQFGIDISQQDVDKAWEAFDSSWEHDVVAPSRSSTSTKRSGVRRGRQDSAEPSTSVTLTVMTKTHDGACREGGRSGFIEVGNASSVVSSFNTASAA
eukprot:scaffold171_cov149-Skeletonema_dohrnii-CCMP3373.AAC.11